MGVNSLPKTVTRQRRGCDLNPGPSAPESTTLTTRLPSLYIRRRRLGHQPLPIFHANFSVIYTEVFLSVLGAWPWFMAYALIGGRACG